MDDQIITFVVLIDYDNLLPGQKNAGILDVVTKALVQAPRDPGLMRARCEVRVYGGWYEGTAITRLAQEVTVKLQDDFPAIIGLPNSGGQTTCVNTNAELARSLMENPGYFLFNTYRKKGKPANIRVKKLVSPPCSSCILPAVNHLLKNGKCPHGACNEDDLVYRHEQKSVDAMLTCDIVYAASRDFHQVVLISGDDDFLPPLQTVVLRGATAIRFHTKPNCQRASFPRVGGELIEKDL